MDLMSLINIPSLITLFIKSGPAWALNGIFLIMIWKMFKEFMGVIKSNTHAISKFSEIVSHCKKKEEIYD